MAINCTGILGFAACIVGGGGATRRTVELVEMGAAVGDVGGESRMASGGMMRQPANDKVPRPTAIMRIGNLIIVPDLVERLAQPPARRAGTISLMRLRARSEMPRALKIFPKPSRCNGWALGNVGF